MMTDAEIHQFLNAYREIEKAVDVLERCEQFFRHQAEMNAAAHLSGNVMYPPIHSSIQSVLTGIANFKRVYSGVIP